MTALLRTDRPSTRPSRLRSPAHRHVRLDGIAWTPDVHLPAIDPDLTGVVRIEPEDGARHLRPARTDQAREPQDLALTDLERDIMEDAGAREADILSTTSPTTTVRLGRAQSHRDRPS